MNPVTVRSEPIAPLALRGSAVLAGAGGGRQELVLEYLWDGRLVTRQAPDRATVGLDVLVALGGRFRPVPDLLRFDCGTCYRLGDRIDWSCPGGLIEVVRVPRRGSSDGREAGGVGDGPVTSR